MPLTAWPSITVADYSMGSDGLTTTMVAKFVNASEHLKQVLYGDGSFVGAYPHTHLGVEDALIIPTHTGNLLYDFAPDVDAVQAWTKSGYTIGNDKGWYTTTTSGHYTYQVILLQASNSNSAFGAGADLTLSLWIRSQADQPTAGEIHFGLADGGTTFKASCKAVITAAMLRTAYVRFAMRLPAASVGNPTTDLRFLIKNHTTPPNKELIITAIDCRVGHVLARAEPGLLDSPSNHDDWQKYGLSDCPMWDHEFCVDGVTWITGT